MNNKTRAMPPKQNKKQTDKQTNQTKKDARDMQISLHIYGGHFGYREIL